LVWLQLVFVGVTLMPMQSIHTPPHIPALFGLAPASHKLADFLRVIL
jgi:hypothetical protein